MNCRIRINKRAVDKLEREQAVNEIKPEVARLARKGMGARAIAKRLKADPKHVMEALNLIGAEMVRANVLRLCACGCGARVERRFRQGHDARLRTARAQGQSGTTGEPPLAPCGGPGELPPRGRTRKTPLKG